VDIEEFICLAITKRAGKLGFAEGTDAACDSSLAQESREYYFTVCEFPDACGRELLLPLLTCSFCSACTYLVSDEPQDCKEFSCSGRVGGEQLPIIGTCCMWCLARRCTGTLEVRAGSTLTVFVLAAVFGAEIICVYECTSR